MDTEELRRRAHNAPLARISEENINGQPTGRKFISDHTDAWARFSREWMEAVNKAEKK